MRAVPHFNGGKGFSRPSVTYGICKGAHQNCRDRSLQSTVDFLGGIWINYYSTHVLAVFSGIFLMGHGVGTASQTESTTAFDRAKYLPTS